MKRIVITGASSFIGRHIINKLINEKEWIIYAVIRSKSALETWKNVSCIKTIVIDMYRYKYLSDMIETADVAIHLAWEGTRGDDRKNKEIQKKNMQYSLDLLEELKKMRIRTIVSAGSQAEYGPYNKKISEDTVPHPITAYGIYKLKFYEQMSEFCESNNIRCIEPRFFSLYGEGDADTTLISSTIKKMQKNEACYFSTCEQVWNFLHIDDAVNGIVNLIKNKQCHGIYNFGSNDTRKLKVFVLTMAKLLKTKSKLYFGARNHNDTGVYGIDPNITKLSSTGWTPEITFEDGIMRLVEKFD